MYGYFSVLGGIRVGEGVEGGGKEGSDIEEGCVLTAGGGGLDCWRGAVGVQHSWGWRWVAMVGYGGDGGDGSEMWERWGDGDEGRWGRWGRWLWRGGWEMVER